VRAQEFGDFLRRRRGDLDRLEARLEPLRQQIELQVARADECLSRREPVEVAEQDVLRILLRASESTTYV
jgi:hypothetical protein